MVDSNSVVGFHIMINTKKLRTAIKAVDIPLIKELLAAEPKNSIRLYHDWTPLHTAVKLGNKDVVAAIIETGADVNAITDMYETALDIAQGLGHERIAALLKKHHALRGAELELHPAIAAGDLQLVKQHLKSGATVDQQFNKITPIGLALKHRRWNVASFLLKQKCDVTKTLPGHETPLHTAAANGAPEAILSKILKLGAFIDEVDDFSDTPLSNAAYAGNEELCDWLIDHGADVSRGRGTFSTPVYHALRGGHHELASHLIERGGKATLHQCVQCNHLARARQMLSSGADPNHEEDPDCCNTPLETAIFNDSVEMVQLLIEFGADPNQQNKISYGRDGGYGGDTALHAAVSASSAKMVKLLLAHGADPDISNANGLSPIEEARRRDRTHLVNLMEANIDKKLSMEATQNGIDQLYTVQKVAELLSVDDAFVLELIKTKKITGIKLNDRMTRIPAGSIQRYLAKLTK